MINVSQCQWYSWAGFLAIVALHHRITSRHKDNRIASRHKGNRTDRTTTASSASPPRPTVAPAFPWEPRTTREASLSQTLPLRSGTDEYCIKIPRQRESVAAVAAEHCPDDARRQLHFLASMTFANGLRAPSCPCCR